MATDPASERDPLAPETIRVLVENHREFLRFLEHRVGERALAEDLLQEAFARGIDKIDSLREGDSAVAWFYRALRNAIVDHHRRAGAAARAYARFAAELSGAEEPPADVAEAVCGCVSRLAATLKPEYAEAIEQIDLAGRSVKDFAADHGITSGNAAVRVFRAREALRRRVVASCGTCAEHGCYECSCRARELPAG
jgi:RNA polymerase sigma factor (sigma-70 family)